MKHKTLHIPADCENAVMSALRIRVEHLQAHRRSCEQHGYPRAQDAIMDDIACAKLTMIADNLDKAELSQ